MTKQDFISRLRSAVENFIPEISTKDGQWVVKGFIDTYKHVYSISPDTKVISKIMELYLFPLLAKFAEDNNLEVLPAKEQNYYPDLTFRDSEGNLFAVDLKSSYRKGSERINGMTLGAFTGYFRNRESTKNVTFPYKAFEAHIVLGVIYSANKDFVDEGRFHTLEHLDDIVSVVRDIRVFVQEKWRIASDRPGSGNTKNIGSITSIEGLMKGEGVFAELGEDVFDDYWMNYLTNEMAKRAELSKPYYSDVASYRRFRKL